MVDTRRPQPIAIVGLAGRFPGARGLDAFWRNVREGVETIEPFTDADLDAAGVDAALRAHPTYVRKGTVLEDADHFDAAFFGFPPREAQTLDPQQRIFLECTWEALEHAGYAGPASAGQSVGVYAGVGLNTYVIRQLLANPPFVASIGGYQLMVGNDKDFLATRVAYKLDLRGPCVTVQTACSTSLVAVEMACRALQHGECDMALAGGVAVTFPQRGGYLFEEGMILSPDGHCRPFDVQARGTRAGAGAGVVVLKRLGDALADRDTVHAVILGAAVNNDGAGKAGYTAPSVEGQVEVIALAQALAGVDPRSISYVEAHGTGTPLGDPIEIAALTQAFRASTQDVGFCRIGSLKANIGHLDAAAGVAGLIKTVLALTHRELPPLVNFQRPNPELDLERSPFVASASLAPWTTTSGAPRRAGVSSFGIGGTNAHVVLEEAPDLHASTPDRDIHLLVLSAKTPSALERATVDLAAHLERHPELSLADVGWTLKVGRQRFAHGRAVVVRDAKRAAEILGERPHGAAVLDGTYEGAARPVAFLFSGQGSQHVGMGAGLYATERVYREAIDRCAKILEPHLGLDMRKVLFGDDTDETIHETRLTQPLLFATEYALASLWMSWGIVPSAMLGHSIGEYVAAHLAGVFSLEDVLAVVSARGRLMQALPAGAMAAVHLAGAALERHLTGGVEIAAFNAPGLCTVSGTAEAVASLLERLEAKGIEARALHTSHAFHSVMMEPALAPFASLLEKVELSPPTIPYASNLTGTWITPEQATSPAYYARHLRRAVRFEECVRLLAADRANVLLEAGPRNALTTLARLTIGRDGPRRVFPSLSHPRERRPDTEAVLEAAARLWLAGATLDWSGMHDGEQLRRVPLPTYPFERSRYWVDALPRDASKTAPSAGPPPKAIDEWLYAPTWTRDDSAVGSTAPLEGTWLVLTEPSPIGQAVVRSVQAAGAVPVVVEIGARFEKVDARRFRVRPGFEDDIASAIREVKSTSGPITGAIYLWALSSDPAAAPVTVRYDGLVALATGLEAAFGDEPGRILVVTNGAESVLAEPVRRPYDAVVLGPVLVLPTELPGLRMRAVDLDFEASTELEAVREIVQEAARADDERVVARRGRRRWVRRFEPFSLPPADAALLPLEPRGVYLVTGGLGGIGLTLARWLASHARARLVLTARTPLPARQEWDAWLASHDQDDRASRAIVGIREIEEAGGEVIVAAADAADEAAMRRAIDEANERWGKINGVIHAAGVAGTGTVALRKQTDEVKACLSPKVDGLEVLVRLLGNTSLDFVALQSSVNSVLGAPGACDYASANAFLDAFVDSSACPERWRRVVSFNWGPWRDVGMAAKRLATDTDKAALAMSISPAAGADIFARVLASGRRRVVVAPFDLTLAIAYSTAAAAASAARGADVAAPSAARGADVRARAPTAEAQERPQLSTTFVAPSSDTERRMATIWSDLLGVEPVGVHDDFFELGGHSLLATRVLARVDDLFGVRLTLRNVFEAPTIQRLSELADRARASAAFPPPIVAEGREEMEF